MLKKALMCVCVVLLSACSASGSTQNQMYGEIKGGVESVRHQ